LATEIVHAPINPSFGGSPLNGPVLLNSANAQNHYTASSSSSGYKAPTALETFNQRLQSMILDKIASSVSGKLFDTNGNLKAGTTLSTDGFTVSIVDLLNGKLQVTTTDKATGATTTFEVSSGL
jgi:curli production assembly/transport component CsgF